MSSAPSLTTRAVVVGRHASGEGSVRAALYSEDVGLVEVFAKSAREERSKLRAHLTVGCVGEYTFVKGARGWRVTGAVNVTNVHFATVDNEKQKSVARVLSLVRQLVHGEGLHVGLFEALDDFFKNNDERRAVAKILLSLGYLSSDDLDSNSESLTRAINRGLSASGLA